MNWTLEEIIALSRVGKLSHAKRIALVEGNLDLSEALRSIGAMDIDIRSEARKIIGDAKSHGVNVLTVWDEDFPSSLKNIEQPPMVLYVWGVLPKPGTPMIGVVGTRTCTVHYGKPATEMLVETWTKHGVCIISGLANGIDTLAHESCLRHRGTTIAVIASGIGRITPKNASALSKSIVGNGGAVVSEHPHHVAALPPYFPARNRIISALSDALVVVESKETGGALITAAFAKAMGRPVWAVPGPITSTRSTGTNALIASGDARILKGAEALLKDLHINETVKSSKPLPPDLEALGGDPVSAETVARLWDCTIEDALARLFVHEMSGHISQLPGRRFLVT